MSFRYLADRLAMAFISFSCVSTRSSWSASLTRRAGQVTGKAAQKREHMSKYIGKRCCYHIPIFVAEGRVTEFEL